MYRKRVNDDTGVREDVEGVAEDDQIADGAHSRRHRLQPDADEIFHRERQFIFC